jgi:hypothetical protein
MAISSVTTHSSAALRRCFASAAARAATKRRDTARHAAPLAASARWRLPALPQTTHGYRASHAGGGASRDGLPRRADHRQEGRNAHPQSTPPLASSSRQSMSGGTRILVCPAPEMLGEIPVGETHAATAGGNPALPQTARPVGSPFVIRTTSCAARCLLGHGTPIKELLQRMTKCDIDHTLVWARGLVATVTA